MRTSAQNCPLLDFLASRANRPAFSLDASKACRNSEIVAENEETKSARRFRRRRLAIEALVLFVFTWVAVLVASLLGPGPMDSFANAGILKFVKSTLLTGLEVFVLSYVLSRFFKQFKTGCAFVIIFFLAYLIWAGSHSR